VRGAARQNAAIRNPSPNRLHAPNIKAFATLPAPDHDGTGK